MASATLYCILYFIFAPFLGMHTHSRRLEFSPCPFLTFIASFFLPDAGCEQARYNVVCERG
jgi:hypothetical protein